MRPRGGRSLAAGVAVLMLAGCGQVDPCEGQGGACIGIVLTGDVGTIDSVHIDLTGAVNHSFNKMLPNGSSSLPIAVPVLVGDAAKGGVSVGAVALLGGATVGLGTATF